MARIVLSVFTTLDGVIENPHEWASGFVSEDSMQAGLDQIRAARAFSSGVVLLTCEPTGEGLADPGAARRAAEANAKG
ncbi:hypothetical protein AB0B54_24740 [Microbispora bryophytorum]|uniref:hypothetical protein n=1 Tax=Microbispora bryophytorum TaxID=1460882 RepID=UPI0033E2FF05